MNRDGHLNGEEPEKTKSAAMKKGKSGDRKGGHNAGKKKRKRRDDGARRDKTIVWKT